MSEDDGRISQGSGSAVPADDAIRRAAAFIDGRSEEYLRLLTQATESLSRGEYTSTDLITDSFTLWGKGLRDLQALSQAWWQVSPQSSGTSGPAGPRGTIFNDCDVDFSKEFGESGPRPLQFVCSDLRYRSDRSVAVPASSVIIESNVDPKEGKGFVRVTIQAIGLDSGLLLGLLFESANPGSHIATINMSVPPEYSRY